MKKVAQIFAEDKTLFGLVPAKTPVKTPVKRKRSTTPKAPRNYATEIETAHDTLFDKAVNFGIQRKTGENPELTQIATALILCGLPYRKIDEFEFSRSSRAADGSTIRVTFYSVGKDEQGNRIPLAFGSDRTPLHWCIDKAIKTGSSFVQLDSAREFIADLGQVDSGENYKRMRQAFNRISSLSITVERFRDGDQNRSILPIIEHSHLPASLQPGVTNIAGPLGIRFGEAFFAEFTKHHVPFPTSFLRDLSKKPQMQDYIVFLNWRSYAAKTTTNIPWNLMREQLWQEDSNPHRIKTRFAEAISLLKVAWPELNAEATSRGLRIGPPHRGMHLFPSHNKESKYN
jgi:Plasmid encoded RepA protein